MSNTSQIKPMDAYFLVDDWMVGERVIVTDTKTYLYDIGRVYTLQYGENTVTDGRLLVTEDFNGYSAEFEKVEDDV